jgi:hypothetical protein
MRTQILAYLTANLTGSIKTSQELPFDQGGQPLYLKNMRKVYVDESYTEQSELIPLLDDNDINQNIIYVRAYLAMDAKNRNSDLDSALAIIAQAKSTSSITSSFRKEFDYTTTIDNDVLLYEFEYRFYTIA